MMDALTITYYTGGLLMIVFAIMSVTSSKLLRSAIYLLFVLLGVAIFYLIMDYMFLAAVQVVVYTGGILVLIIFSILLTSHINERLEVVRTITWVSAALASVLGAGIIVSVIRGHAFNDTFVKGNETTVADIGTKLLSYEKYGYVLPFEVISILLLAAMVAAIVIAKRTKQNS